MERRWVKLRWWGLPTVVWLRLHQSFGDAWEHVLCVRLTWLCNMALLPAFFVALDKLPPLGEGSQWGPPSRVGEGIT